jgi:hypothetical protein
MLGFALGMTDDFSVLFSTKAYSSINDLLKQKIKKRQRGKRNE